MPGFEVQIPNSQLLSTRSQLDHVRHNAFSIMNAGRVTWYSFHFVLHMITTWVQILFNFWLDVARNMNGLPYYI